MLVNRPSRSILWLLPSTISTRIRRFILRMCGLLLLLSAGVCSLKSIVRFWFPYSSLVFVIYLRILTKIDLYSGTSCSFKFWIDQIYSCIPTFQVWFSPCYFSPVFIWLDSLLYIQIIQYFRLEITIYHRVKG